MRRFQGTIAVAALLMVSGIGAGCWLFARQVQRSEQEISKDNISYRVLEDDMGTTIRIGVISTIGEKELRATLVKAADEHQDDPARDYLVSMFLLIEAYLVTDDNRSTTPAGILRRYVPPGNPAERKTLTIDRTKADTFTISIDEASRTLTDTATTTLIYKLNNQNSKNERVVNATPDICDLVRRPENYDSKIVRLRSVLMGFHELALYSRCDGQISYIRADLDSNTRSELVKGVADLEGRGMQRGNFWVEVVANGRFEKIAESDCKNLTKESGLPNRYYPNYCYRIAIENLERVDPVSPTVAWPQ